MILKMRVKWEKIIENHYFSYIRVIKLHVDKTEKLCHSKVLKSFPECNHIS